MKNSISKVKISGIVFGRYLFGLVAYSLYQSDQQCLRCFGRRGFLEDCSDSKFNGIVALVSTALLGMVFFVVGFRNIRNVEKTEADGQMGADEK